MSLTKEKAKEEIQKYIDAMKDIYVHLLSFIDNPDSKAEGDYQELIKVNAEYDIEKSKEQFNRFIGLLVDISNNHFRQPFFFDKIDRILLQYSDTIKTNNTNIEIFHKFSSNKRLLYFLIKEQILTVDAQITQLIGGQTEKNGIRYSNFFLNEIKKSDNDEMKYYEEHHEEYEEKRKAGENDSYICSLIREDSVEEFVQYVNQMNISPSDKIKPSIFETNSFLIDKEPSLIEYAAFFGSIEIFQYLYDNKAKINGSLWLYAIHSNNSDLLVNYIQLYNIEPTDRKYEEVLKESIKCNHNDFANYIQDNFIEEEQTTNDKITLNERVFDEALKCHNYSIVSKLFNQNYTFFYFCKYNYQYIVDRLIESQRDNIEKKIIQTKKNIIFLIEFQINNLMKFIKSMK